MREQRSRGLRRVVTTICACVVLLLGLATIDVASADPLPPPPFETQGLVMDTFYNGFGDPVPLRRGYWSADARSAASAS